MNISFSKKLHCLIFLFLFTNSAINCNIDDPVLKRYMQQRALLKSRNSSSLSMVISYLFSKAYKFLSGIKLLSGKPLTAQEKFEEFRKKIRESKGNQYLYDAICSAQDGKLQDASILLEQARDAYIANGAESLNAIHVVADFIEAEKKRYHDLCIDKHELPYAFANDPLYAEYHKILDEYGPNYEKMHSNAMLHLTLRQMAVQGLYEKLEIAERTALLDKIFYDICELQHHPVQTLEYLTSQDICKNSLIEEHRNACSILFTESGLLKLYEYRSEYVTENILYPAINNSENLAARILQTEFFMHDAKSSQEIALIKLGLACIHKSVACEGIACKVYSVLARNFYEILTIENKVQEIYSLSGKIKTIADIINDGCAVELQLQKIVGLILSDERLSQHFSRDLIALYEQLIA